MSNDEKTPLTVEGLGEKTVPDVKGMNNASAEEAKVDVTSMPTVSEPAPVERVDVTSTPTVSAPKEPETFDPTSMPSANSAPSKPIDYKKIGMIAGGAFAGIALLILIISLVGGKKIVCTYDKESNGVKTSRTITYKFDGDGKLKAILMEGKEDYSKAEGDYKPSEEELKKFCEEELKDDKNAKCKATKNTIKYSTKETDKEKLEKNYDSKEYNYDKMKEQVKSKNGNIDGMTCKVK
jgi:hypothetical protein